MAYEFEQSIFPDFPRTEHLPAFADYKPNASSDDKVAGKDAFSIILANLSYAEEKIDGANSGVMFCPSLESEVGQPFMLRNRNHILRKGYSAKTKGKQQFVPFWNWYYSHADRFEKLNNLVGFEAVVYGEWLWPKNPCTIVYDFKKVPNNFIAYDVWNWHEKKFHPYPRAVLSMAGFDLPPLLMPTISSLNVMPSLLNDISEWAAPADKQIEPCQCKREGLYIKVSDGDRMIARYKMVRPDYKPGMFFSE
jgi:hypothetical protein